MNKKWEIYQTNEEKVEELQKKYKLNRLLSTLLTNRGIIEEAEITKFLNPKRSDFYDPFGMPDMEKAAERILKAIKDKEQIIIYGDYDVDGITSVTVLKSFLEERGIQVNVYIPNRLNEGYGLNKTAMEEIAKQGNKLMITVDCGITAVDEVEYAKTFGIETIITDHHEPAEELPKAIAVVDAKRKDNKYECRNLAGVGVVFKLIQALSIKLGLDPKEYLKYLDIVCVGTISDIVPLTDENRVIVKLGLKLVEQTKNLGLKEILQSCGYSKINSTTISFGVAPRINACGRMGHQEEALNLLLSIFLRFKRSFLSISTVLPLYSNSKFPFKSSKRFSNLFLNFRRLIGPKSLVILSKSSYPPFDINSLICFGDKFAKSTIIAFAISLGFL